MEKTIVIDGKQINLKSTGGTILRYKNQTNRELLVDLSNISEFAETHNFSDFDIGVLCDIIWVLAKTADPNIPCVEEWLDSFDSFPIVEVFSVAMELLTNSIASKKNV